MVREAPENRATIGQQNEGQDNGRVKGKYSNSNIDIQHVPRELSQADKTMLVFVDVVARAVLARVAVHARVSGVGPVFVLVRVDIVGIGVSVVLH